MGGQPLPSLGIGIVPPAISAGSAGRYGFRRSPTRAITCSMHHAAQPGEWAAPSARLAGTVSGALAVLLRAVMCPVRVMHENAAPRRPFQLLLGLKAP